ncbi:hypothetical protein FALBO_5265 [Fusarium albosuccineum]|uniref:PD-(D/E)XK nuclease-like domain-containing protein n=1 Tax=Fusarium albosuccineum TaxID=1237068 RepID=A0A8H4PCV8_9HYPO|nr:hypothetical protein FALBO_5265 [Fusarium albosuccineum]
MPDTREKSPKKRKTGSEYTLPSRSGGFRSEIDLVQPSESSLPGSGRLSPSKQFHLWRLQPGGIDYGDLSCFADKPRSLRRLLGRIGQVMEGFAIISTTQRDEILQAAESCDDEFDWAVAGSHYFSAERDALGTTPSVSAVLDILDNAAECNTHGHHEDAWNKAVHTPVLALAFHQDGKRIKNQLITSASCIHASIMPEYGTSGMSKKVDFCVYINPQNDSPPKTSSPVADAIGRIVHQLPGKVFNFTDFEPIQMRPIALSIETKKPTEGFDVAKLQLGVWQMAHWAFLKTLISIQQTNERQRQVVEQQDRDPPGDADDMLMGQPAQASPPHQDRASSTQHDDRLRTQFELPEFLPGIIINGHNWWFTVTSFDGSRVKFWEKAAIGSTDNTRDIYKLEFQEAIESINIK